MVDLFEKKLDNQSNEEKTLAGKMPLAAFMRPTSFDDFVGQSHILADGKLLRRAIDADRFSSIILSGPPGTGKTSLAELIALQTNSAFIRLSGTSSSVGEIRKEISYAVNRSKLSGRRTILFIDEIHRFNKAQQDVLLPDLENGNIRMIGATTHNPNFYIVPALLSRSLVFMLEPLSKEAITNLLSRAVSKLGKIANVKIQLDDDASAFLATASDGDARKALNALEIALSTTKISKNDTKHISIATAEESIQIKKVNYDQNEHYDTISAFIKSMRGSDPDAALYWLAKMLYAGEDIRFIARRITIFASEDIGNADPRAISLSVNAMQAVEMIGMPEARIILAQAVTYCATAPKSNASYQGINSALHDIENQRILPVPKYLRNANCKTTGESENSTAYIYPHDERNQFAVQDYLGINKKYYVPVETGYELKINERLRYWEQLREGATVK